MQQQLFPDIENTVVKSVYHQQDDILKSIIRLHCPEGIQTDLTYGNGSFYKNIEKPEHMFDIQPLHDGVIESCSTNTPMENKSLKSVAFDPPFLTYIRNNRSGNGNMIMSKRFSGYWRYDELLDHYFKTIQEVARILKSKGVFIFKCQDIIHNHKMHCTHNEVINHCCENGFRLLDLFILAAKHRLPAPNKKKTQKHASVFHSYFLVFKKL